MFLINIALMLVSSKEDEVLSFGESIAVELLNQNPQLWRVRQATGHNVYQPEQARSGI